MSGPTDQNAKALYSKNLRAFAGYRKEVLKTLPGDGAESSTIVVDNGYPENIKIVDVDLYPEPARNWTAKQVENYLRDPDRLKVPNPLDDSQPKVSHNLAADLAQFGEDVGCDEQKTYPQEQVGFTFVFGVGLGYHIDKILESCPCEQMIVIEPVPEFFKYSMRTIDWQAIIEKAKAKGTALQFKIGLSPERFMLETEALIIRSRGGRFIDGTYAYVHYPSWQVMECRKLLNQRIGNFLIRPGHFGDEKIMMTNAIDNLSKRSFRLIEAQKNPDLDVPVFVVGSGPSLDDDIGKLSELSGKALIASCGSSLGILLKNGIVPDFHLENENTYPLVKNLKAFREDYDFTSTVLIASSTVNPEVGEMFGRNWFYFRSTLSPAVVLAPGYNPIIYAGPLVANAALAALSNLGFKRFVLFGIDCGRLEGGLHHSKDAVYYEEGYDNFIEGEGHDYLEGEFTRIVPGNFGGKIATSAYYDLSRRTITELIRDKNLAVTNCSRGAQIEGAQPLLSGKLELPSLPAEKKTYLAEVESRLAAFGPGEFLEHVDFDLHIEACLSYRQALKSSLENDQPSNYIQLQRRLDTIMGEGGASFAGLDKLATGTLLSLMRVGSYRGSRIADKNRRAEAFEFFLKRFEFYAGEALDEIADFLKGLGQNDPE